MRELRVIGLDSTGQNVVCQEVSTGEKFTIPSDDRLRAAARGDLSRLGQIEIETDSQLRPREIQARIRAGASVQEVATQAGVSITRVERFAHPVLLERARAAELAMKAHPVRADGPTVLTLSEIVAAAFGARGQDPESAEWDSWRGKDGQWVVRLQWQSGHSDLQAHWRFHRDTHGGTVTPIDDAATELVDPDSSRPLRTVAPVAALGESRAADQDARATDRDEVTDGADTAELPVPHEAPDMEQTARTGTDEHTDSTPSSGDPAPENTEEQARPSAGLPAPRTPARHARKKNGKPPMPSWEDVLLGVRSSGRG